MRTPMWLSLSIPMLAALSAFAAAPAPRAGSTTDELSGPYEDPLQTQIPFGVRSFYLTPWRGYMDTWPASRWLEMPGVTFGGHPATAKILASAGFHAARVEWGWCNVTWDGDRFSDEPAKRETLRGLRDAGMRPLILLNAHHGLPGPTRTHNVNLKEDAPKGQRFVVLDDTSVVRIGYCGLTNLNDYRASFPEIIAVGEGGRCELSAPLPVDVKAGPIAITETKYRPFSGAVFADGTPNPASAETMQGWLDYVGAVCRVAKEGLGTTGNTEDAGFDLEVWNEYTFGSCFLDINNYFEPDLEFKEPMAYRGANGREVKGSEAILPLTVDYIADPAHGCPGVRVLSGFSNQRPWDDLAGRWPTQAGISRHYYTGAGLIVINPDHPDSASSRPVNALGEMDGEHRPPEWHGGIPGSFFIPDQRWALPEYWHYGIKTEFIIRDIMPFPPVMDHPWAFVTHFRYGDNGDGRQGMVWRTETNFWRWEWAEKLIKQYNLDQKDPRLVSLMHQMGARWVLRLLMMSAHKGETTHTVFQANEPDDCGLGVIPSSYFELLKSSNGEPTPELCAAIGPQVQTIGRVTAIFRKGADIDVARKVRVDKLVEHDPRLVWKGNGTADNPDRFNRDDFAILPFQLDARTFEIAYYVVTHDCTTVYDESADPLDPARYSMPPQTFDITLGNVRGKRAKVTAYDPVADTSVPVAIVASTADTLTVRVESVDYPRFFRVEEKEDGPMLSGVAFSRDDDGAPVVTFTGNVKGEVEVSCGTFPNRVPTEGAGSTKMVKVRRGETMSVRLEGADLATDAVLLRYRVDGLELRWPQWDYDFRGRLKYALSEETGSVPGKTGSVPEISAPTETIRDLPLSDPSQAVHD